MLNVLLIAALQTGVPDAGTISRISESVFRLRCEVYDNGNWVPRSFGSAFAWGAKDEVVTALHVVATCGRLVLESESRGSRRPAVIERVVAQRDLALLKIVQAPDAPWSVIALSPSPAKPALWDSFAVVGYALGMPSLQPKRLGYHKLMAVRDVVPAAVLDQIVKARWFEPATEVHVFSEGHLAPGHSGAPIIDGEGRVMAVAQGGLENGTSEIGWGLGVKFLGSLANGTVNIPTDLRRIDALFSSEQQTSLSSPTAHVRCGGARLSRMRVASLSDLRATADDPIGLVQLETNLSMGGLAMNTGAFEYDIWRDLESGASIPVPKGQRVIAENGRCAIYHHGYSLALYFTVDPVSNFSGAIDAAMMFQRSWLGNRIVSIDPNFTYAQPQQRWDGLLVNRAAILISEPRLVNGFSMPIPVTYAFQSVATKGRGSLGMAVARNGFEVETSCMYQGMPNTNECNAVRDRRELFAQFVLGTHLAGWPRG
jgi:hypothetical protein